MTRWISNSSRVMEHISTELRSKSIVSLNFEEWPTFERVLGFRPILEEMNTYERDHAILNDKLSD